MVFQLKKPELEKFIADQVRAGLYASREAAIKAAVERMMIDHGELDNETIAAINQADEQYARGEFVEWRDVRDELRKKYTGK